MSEFVIDASLALQWFLEDELDRGYSLAVLAQLAENRAVVPLLWFYEVGNGLTVACRRRRITYEQAAAISPQSGCFQYPQIHPSLASS